MTDRDHFAAAALTGLLYPEVDDEFAMPYIVGRAYLWADAMLRERCRGGGDCPGSDNAPNLDAAPEATAPEPEPSAARRRPAGGTGDTVLGASPEARASVESVVPQPTTHGDSDRTDKAAPRPSDGTGDTPATHATHGEGSVRRECTEPVAWAVCCPGDGNWSPCFFHEPHAQRHASAILGSKNIIPLYRKPTLTDAEAETLRELRDEAAQYADEIGLCASEVRGRQRIIDGLLVRLGGER